MSTDDRIEELVNLLVRGTRDNSLEWQFTPDENTFRLASSVANVRLSRSEHFDSEVGEIVISRSLSVLNDKGRTIEDYSPKDTRNAGLIDELFAAARRSAYKTDEVLDRLVGEIKSRIGA